MPVCHGFEQQYYLVILYLYYIYRNLVLCLPRLGWCRDIPNQYKNVLYYDLSSYSQQSINIDNILVFVMCKREKKKKHKTTFLSPTSMIKPPGCGWLHLPVASLPCTIFIFREQKRTADIMANARATEGNNADDDKEPTGCLGRRGTGQRPVESRLLSVEGIDRRLGDVRQHENPFGRTITYRRQ